MCQARAWEDGLSHGFFLVFSLLSLVWTSCSPELEPPANMAAYNKRADKVLRKAKEILALREITFYHVLGAATIPKGNTKVV
uniref:Putative secreted protein n=1 Tax=Anopheles marajoara TaxID=58244 RepID=A0A2M4CBB8_9DIPT